MANKAKENEGDTMDNDDVQEITNPDVGQQSKELGSTNQSTKTSIAKRKRGRPRKLVNTQDSLKQEFSIEAITKRVTTQKGRATKPGPQKCSPYKQL